MTRKVTQFLANKKAMGMAFKAKSSAVQDHVAALSPDKVDEMEAKLNAGETYAVNVDGTDYEITKDMMQGVKRFEEKVFVEEIIPSVIEPSFGIGRIMYSLLEHNFKVRKDDEQRTFFSLPPLIAPVKCSVLPLSNSAELAPLVKDLSKRLTEAEVSHKVDDSSGSIGRRYARTDEVAIPFGLCVDFDSLKLPHTVTIRERDSTLQVRVPVEEVANVVREMSLGRTSWQEVMNKYPKFEQQESSAK